MGPRSFERGNSAETFRFRGRRIASMGPRSFERGNHDSVMAETLLLVPLQWGRAHSSAEIKGIFG